MKQFDIKELQLHLECLVAKLFREINNAHVLETMASHNQLIQSRCRLAMTQNHSEPSSLNTLILIHPKT